jgi:hypothetical protein
MNNLLVMKSALENSDGVHCFSDLRRGSMNATRAYSGRFYQIQYGVTEDLIRLMESYRDQYSDGDIMISAFNEMITAVREIQMVNELFWYFCNGGKGFSSCPAIEKSAGLEH